MDLEVHWIASPEIMQQNKVWKLLFLCVQELFWRFLHVSKILHEIIFSQMSLKLDLQC